MQTQMPDERSNRTSTEDPPYRVYGSGRSGERESRSGDRGSAGRPPEGGGVPYKTYRSLPRGLKSRLRGEDDLEISPGRSGGGPREPGRGRGRPLRAGGGGYGQPWWRRQLRPRRLILWVVGLIVFWVALSAVLFMISAQNNAGNLPAGATSQLTSAGPILTSANTVAILGLDNRPTTGADSKEPGANFSEKDANTDTIMLWRIGGGVSRRLSIPRDTLVNIPGLGQAKINAAWAYGGPGLALRVIKQFTGLQINHLIVVDLGNFPKFIDDIGGVTVKTPRICSSISGGAADGGFTLNLRPGTHHLTGAQAMVLARTRENACNPAYNDINREAMQQQILNGIKSQLFSVHAFLHLPWAAWDAPGVVQTDMGGLSLLQLFAASEIGGSAPTGLLHETNSTYNGADVLIPSQRNVRSAVNKLMNG
jgi:LCP family protein required for cell wall assembly